MFMLGGITAKWKQPVAYFYTPGSVDGSVFEPIVKDILQEAKKIDLKVKAVVSDMGGSNQKM